MVEVSDIEIERNDNRKSVFIKIRRVGVHRERERDEGRGKRMDRDGAMNGKVSVCYARLSRTYIWKVGRCEFIVM